jgi:hypothetical protein
MTVNGRNIITKSFLFYLDIYTVCIRSVYYMYHKITTNTSSSIIIIKYKYIVLLLDIIYILNNK